MQSLPSNCKPSFCTPGHGRGIKYLPASNIGKYVTLLDTSAQRPRFKRSSPGCMLCGNLTLGQQHRQCLAASTTLSIEVKWDDARATVHRPNGLPLPPPPSPSPNTAKLYQRTSALRSIPPIITILSHHLPCFRPSSSSSHTYVIKPRRHTYESCQARINPASCRESQDHDCRPTIGQSRLSPAPQRHVQSLPSVCYHDFANLGFRALHILVLLPPSTSTALLYLTRPDPDCVCPSS